MVSIADCRAPALLWSEGISQGQTMTLVLHCPSWRRLLVWVEVTTVTTSMDDTEKECNRKVTQSSRRLVGLSYCTSASVLLLINTPTLLLIVDSMPSWLRPLVQEAVFPDASSGWHPQFIDVNGSAPDSGNALFCCHTYNVAGSVY